MTPPTHHEAHTAALMARISLAASNADGDLSKTALLKIVPGGGSDSEKRWAIQALIADGYLSEWVQRTTHWLTHVKLFTSDDDPSLRKCAREECGREFHASRGWHRFCSPLCRERNHRPLHERSCELCGQPFTTTRNRQRYCKPACGSAAYEERFMRAAPPVVVLTAGTQGAVSEMMAAVDLLRRGYEVFRALSPNAGCDLIALKGGSMAPSLPCRQN